MESLKWSLSQSYPQNYKDREPCHNNTDRHLATLQYTHKTISILLPVEISLWLNGSSLYYPAEGKSLDSKLFLSLPVSMGLGEREWPTSHSGDSLAVVRSYGISGPISEERSLWGWAIIFGILWVQTIHNERLLSDNLCSTIIKMELLSNKGNSSISYQPDKLG